MTKALRVINFLSSPKSQSVLASVNSDVSSSDKKSSVTQATNALPEAFHGLDMERWFPELNPISFKFALHLYKTKAFLHNFQYR